MAIDASHETIEMLIDPYGNRLQAPTAMWISNGQIVEVDGKFEYLVEACDPCEANQLLAIMRMIDPPNSDAPKSKLLGWALRAFFGRLGSQFDLLNLPPRDAGLIAYSDQCQTGETLKATFDVLTLVAFKMVERQPNL
jgi:hypothetical protein